MADSENAKWSEETYILQQLANELPCVVRVDEGIYGNNDSETFSIGDMIWLEEKRTIQKIVSQYVDISDWSVEEEEILIPLGFQCPVKVVLPENALRPTNLVANLIASFPRYVRVDKDFTSPCGKRFTRGSELELERVLHKTACNAESSLVVKYQNHEITLPSSLSGLFTPLEDYTIYSLKEIIDRYPLPQYVKFLGDEIQNLITTDIDIAIHNVKSFRKYGIFRMSSIESKPVIIGHIKPVSSNEEESKSSFCLRNGIILPLDKGPVLDIAFQTHEYSESSDYEMILARNFSKCSKLGKEAFEGLYVEYKKKPRVYVIPVTPKTKDESFQAKKKLVEGILLNSHPLPPKITGTKIKTLPKEAKRPKLALPSLGDTSQNLSPPFSIGPRIHVRDYEIPINYKNLSPTEPKLDRVRRSGIDVMPAARVTMPKKQNTVDINEKPKKKIIMSPTDLPPHGDTADDPEYTYPDLTQMEFLLDSLPAGKPVGFVSPIAYPKSKKSPSTLDLNFYTVGKLCSELQKCSLDSFADVCQKEQLDGVFISELSDKDLSEIPFNLTHIDILKFHKMKTGWRPKLI